MAFAYGKEHNIPVYYPRFTDQSVSRKTSYNSSFFHKLPFETIKVTKNYRAIVLREKGFQYTKQPVPQQPVNYNCNINKFIGYFQSELYFKAYKNDIMNTFTLPIKFQENVKRKNTKIVNHPLSVSIHVRRGDYMNIQSVHYIQPIEYYENAIKHYNPKSLFVIFSDDIEWCKKQGVFQSLANKVYVTGEIDYNDLYLMSLCKHNIIANSSFSWWGAYLNLNRKKKVVAPSTWFGPDGPKDTGDLIPSTWITI